MASSVMAKEVGGGTIDYQGDRVQMAESRHLAFRHRGRQRKRSILLKRLSFFCEQCGRRAPWNGLYAARL